MARRKKQVVGAMRGVARLTVYHAFAYVGSFFRTACYEQMNENHGNPYMDKGCLDQAVSTMAASIHVR